VLDTAQKVEEEVVVDTDPAKRILDRFHDRCDRCNAQAFIVATKDLSELLFCGHHGNAHKAALIAQGFEIQDDTDLINTTPSPSANHVEEED
jgi:ribosomal protein L37E